MEGESVANELKKLAEHCGFENAEYLQENLRDWLFAVSTRASRSDS